MDYVARLEKLFFLHQQNDSVWRKEVAIALNSAAKAKLAAGSVDQTPTLHLSQERLDQTSIILAPWPKLH